MKPIFEGNIFFKFEMLNTISSSGQAYKRGVLSNYQCVVFTV